MNSLILQNPTKVVADGIGNGSVVNGISGAFADEFRKSISKAQKTRKSNKTSGELSTGLKIGIGGIVISPFLSMHLSTVSQVRGKLDQLIEHTSVDDTERLRRLNLLKEFYDKRVNDILELKMDSMVTEVEKPATLQNSNKSLKAVPIPMFRDDDEIAKQASLGDNNKLATRLQVAQYDVADMLKIVEPLSSDKKLGGVGPAQPSSGTPVKPPDDEQALNSEIESLFNDFESLNAKILKL